jgi:ribosome maturation factor RimP
MAPLGIDKAEFERYIDQYLFALGYELVDFSMDTIARQWLLSCYIDKPAGGISVGDCQRVNDKLRLVLEADRLAGIEFRLIVSSPGLDRVVKKPADFERFLGRAVKVLFPPSEIAKKGRTLEGVLEAYDRGLITLRMPNGETLQVQQAETKVVRLVPQIDFSKSGRAAGADDLEL